MDVYCASVELSRLEQLPEEHQQLIGTAALFHDAGMLTGYEDHEERSAGLATELLPLFQYSDEQIDRIIRMILSTRFPQQASTLPERILCDADLDYLGRSDFLINSLQLRLEWNLFRIKTYTLSEWFLLQEEFLKRHTFQTESASALRRKGKQQNLEMIRRLNRPEVKQVNQL